MKIICFLILSIFLGSCTITSRTITISGTHINRPYKNRIPPKHSVNRNYYIHKYHYNNGLIWFKKNN